MSVSHWQACVSCCRDGLDKLVRSGVPQGTVLDPVLFLIYINDMTSQVSPGTFLRLFTDDCPVYCEIDTILEQFVVQQDLQGLQACERTLGYAL